MLPHSNETINVTVVAFKSGVLWQRALTLPSGSTAGQSILASGLLVAFPELNLTTLSFGVFGHHCLAHQLLNNHDRVEIYAPLRVDPKVARRRRAAHREKTRNIKKKMPVNDQTHM